jgi:hypothetical protein
VDRGKRKAFEYTYIATDESMGDGAIETEDAATELSVGDWN